LDGDGSLLMHAGTLATIGYYVPKNLTHIVLDNNCYESTGGQPTVSDRADIALSALGFGYAAARTCTMKEELMEVMTGVNEFPLLVVVKVKTGCRKDLGRPNIGPYLNKQVSMKKLQG